MIVTIRIPNFRKKPRPEMTKKEARQICDSFLKGDIVHPVCPDEYPDWIHPDVILAAAVFRKVPKIKVLHHGILGKISPVVSRKLSAKER